MMSTNFLSCLSRCLPPLSSLLDDRVCDLVLSSDLYILTWSGISSKLWDTRPRGRHDNDTLSGDMVFVRPALRDTLRLLSNERLLTHPHPKVRHNIRATYATLATVITRTVGGAASHLDCYLSLAQRNLRTHG